MIKYIFIFFILLLQITCFAQKPSIYLSGKLFYTSQSNFSFGSSSQFIPSKEINSVDVFSLEKKLTNTYNSNFGYEITSRAKFRMGKRFKFSVGIGLNYLNFKVNTTNVIRIAAYSSSSSNNSDPNLFFNTLCEGYSHFNSSRQNETRLDGDFSILSAKSPVQLRYTFLDEKLELGLGLFLQVPIYSRSINQFSIFDYKEIDGDLTCESSNHEVVDDFSGLNRTQVGSMFNISYKLYDRVFVEFGLLDYVLGVFEDSEAFRNSKDRYTPTSIYFGLSYKL